MTNKAKQAARMLAQKAGPGAISGTKNIVQPRSESANSDKRPVGHLR
jgi:hypothetical protein